MRALRVTAVDQAISPPSGVTALFSAMFCGLNGTTDKPRRVMTVIYLDQDARLTTPKHKNHEADREAWMPGVAIGATVNSPLNPMLWSKDGEK